MNRKNRRSKVIYGKPIIKKFRADEIITTTLYIPMLVMRNRGWGKKRLGDFLEEIIDQLELLQDGYVSISDMKKAIEQETGIRFN